MKKLENKQTNIKKDGEGGLATYGDLIKVTLSTMGKQRWLPGEIRAINKIVDVIESSNGEFQFEDEDAKYILKCINEGGIPVAGKEAEQFIDDLEQMLKQK